MFQLFTISRFLSNKRLNITEVAHATIKQYVQQLGMVKSYDTWHIRYLLVFSGELIGVIAGTKNVAKQLRAGNSV